MTLSESFALAPGTRVQVHNPRPMSIGTVVSAPTRRGDYFWVRVHWDSEAAPEAESWSRTDLLRPLND